MKHTESKDVDKKNRGQRKIIPNHRDSPKAHMTEDVEAWLWMALFAVVGLSVIVLAIKIAIWLLAFVLAVAVVVMFLIVALIVALKLSKHSRHNHK